ncbi:flowering time control protein FPA [Tanacetum coccineum]
MNPQHPALPPPSLSPHLSPDPNTSKPNGYHYENVEISTIFIDNLSLKTTPFILANAFREFGQIKGIAWRLYRRFAFLKYANKKDATQVIEQMKNTWILDRRVSVYMERAQIGAHLENGVSLPEVQQHLRTRVNFQLVQDNKYNVLSISLMGACVFSLAIFENKEWEFFRTGWLQITGVPLNFATSSNTMSIASRWGDVLYIPDKELPGHYRDSLICLMEFHTPLMINEVADVSLCGVYL